MTRRSGAVLLEVLVAMAIFVASAMVLLGVVRQAGAATAGAVERQFALDLCATALARIEVGEILPEAVDGPARHGTGPESVIVPGWIIRVSTSPTRFPTLMAVSVSAERTAGSSGLLGAGRVVATLHGVAPTRARAGDLSGVWP